MVAELDGPEDRKPQTDEAHSAFTPPPGVGQPLLLDDDQPTSEFALPEGLSTEPPAEPEGSAFELPGGGLTSGQGGGPGGSYGGQARCRRRSLRRTASP